MSYYQQKSIRNLRVIAKERGIKYLVFMNKERLIEVLEMNDNDPSFTTDPEAKAKCFAGYDRWRKNPQNRQKYLDFHNAYNHRTRAEARKVQVAS